MTISTKTFAMLPVAVLKSRAYCDLSLAARCVLVAMAAQYRGGNNGHLVITLSAMREYGMSSPDVIWRAEKALRANLLIELTKQGGLERGASRYALTFQSVDSPAGKRPASHAWRKYKPGIPTDTGPESYGLPD